MFSLPSDPLFFQHVTGNKMFILFGLSENIKSQIFLDVHTFPSNNPPLTLSADEQEMRDPRSGNKLDKNSHSLIIWAFSGWWMFKNVWTWDVEPGSFYFREDVTIWEWFHFHLWRHCGKSYTFDMKFWFQRHHPLLPWSLCRKLNGGRVRIWLYRVAKCSTFWITCYTNFNLYSILCHVGA